MDRIDALKLEVEKLKEAGDHYARVIELIVEELHHLRYREVEVGARYR
jgi:hypothetical protein